MIPDLLPNGYLPVGGRYDCTELEIQERFVEAFAESRTRALIWDDFQSARDLVTSTIPVQAIWFGGSFTSAKPDPGDLDMTFIWDGRAYETLPPEDRGRLAPFRLGGRGVPFHQLRIDSYAINWFGHDRPNPATDNVYLPFRGYWDDWWLRLRTGSVIAAEGSTARRGYLEVRYA
ncbi:DUF6932 family protein [Catelliglobosispora koreensis]|uniref:DUF6932 family protein n=1 Tax=Catelliglobosispora koreensis TaxID=129052 RepID=UPI0004782980|nr:hypothetical protein [Catelliglobosispora koreensis]